MSKDTSITGSIKVEDSSKERVAYDLLRMIASLESTDQDRYLELYSRCLLTVQHPSWGSEEIKKEAKGK